MRTSACETCVISSAIRVVFALALFASLLFGASPSAQAGPAFGSPSTLTVAANPYSTAAADLNRDGRLDLAVANYGSGNVAVLLGNGNGTFGSANYYDVGANPAFVTVADLNRDGKADLVTANYGGDSVSVLLGNGDGTFGAASDIAVGSNPVSILIVDLDRNGKPDMAVANFGSDTVSVMLGNGDGTFGPAATVYMAANPYDMVSADFNKDGKSDLVISNYGGSSIAFIPGDGAGGFGAPVSKATHGGPSGLAVGDFNKDGADDVAVVNRLAGTLQIFTGSGNGTFNLWDIQNPTAEPIDVAAADIDGDGNADLVIARLGSSRISLCRGNGDGTFSSPVDYDAGNGPHSIAIGDFNGDRKPDVAVALSNAASLAVLANTTAFEPAGAFDGYSSELPAGTTVVAVTAGDLNSDGNMDVVSANLNSNNITVRLGSASGSFGPATNYAAQGNTDSVVMADFNRDGKMDIAASNFYGGVSVFLGQGNGAFQAAVNCQTAVDAASLRTADFNRDGIPDLVTSNETTNKVWVLLGNGDGSFGPHQGYATGSLPEEIVVGDFNRDGIPDLAAANHFSDNVSVLLGNGNGTFAAPVNYPVAALPHALEVGDFNKDGKADLAVGSSGTYVIVLLMGNGDGTFTAGASFATGHGDPGVILAEDFNRDGILDLAVHNGDATISLWLGNGDGTFSTGPNYPYGSNAMDLASADFDRDGRPDLAIAGYGNNAVTIKLNADRVPDAFTIPDQSGVALNSLITSDQVVVTGINAGASISLTGGEYRINSGAWTSLTGTVTKGSGVRVRLLSPATEATPASAVLTIGSVSDTFTVTTMVLDTTPDPFVFIDQTGVPLNSLVTSAAVTISGTNAPAPISITGGEYDVNAGGAWTMAPGMVMNGDSVRVRQTASAIPATTTDTILTIGGLSDTFSVTTSAGTSTLIAFTDDMESGTAKWTSSTGLWHVVSGASPYPNSHSPSHSWWYGQDGTGDYNTGAANSGEIVSASFTVPSAASLTFWSWELTESASMTYDTRKVYISTNGGGSWTQIHQSTDNSAAWYQLTIDLAAYAGMNAKLKFAFDTVDGGINQHRGWYVDDVSVSGESPSPGNLTEDFETGNFTNWPWTTGGSGAWTVTGTTPHGGSFAAEAPASLGDSQSSYMEVSRTTGSGTISFWLSVSSEPCCDFLRFYIDGVERASWAGFGSWIPAAFPVTAGSHTFRWEYTKDGSVSSGSDTAWIDDIVITDGSQPPAECAVAVAPGPDSQSAPSINDLGEMVWSQNDPTAGWNQIYSSTRGQLTFGAGWRDSPSVNNRGDVVWEQKYPWEPTGPIYGIISGQTVQIAAADGMLPSINDSQEIVWSRMNSGNWQVYSNRRGYLTTDIADHWRPSINNAGDVVWTQYEPASGKLQVYKLVFGTTTPVQITSDPVDHFSGSISNSGEIVWTGASPGGRVHSSIRGQLTSDNCPAGDTHAAASVNACGDVVFTSLANNAGTIYRLGNSSPCVTDVEPNNMLPEATLVSGNTTTMGMVQDPGDWEDWYKFTANTGDQITVTVNWAPTVAPNMLMVELMDQSGGGLAGAPEPGSPKTITYTAQYSGTYHVHLIAALSSRVGYTLTLKVGIGGGTCADPAVPSLNDQHSSSINDLGEMVWVENGQIYSNTRGQLTSDLYPHDVPSVNNRGDVVWVRKNYFELEGPIYGLIGGQQVQLSATPGDHPSINDTMEIVWSQWNNGHLQVYSNRRGYLTTDLAEHWSTSINNAGDVVWTQFDPISGRNQIFKLKAGESQPVQITSDAVNHGAVSISNNGEIVWQEGTWPGQRLRSSVRGGLTFGGCPAGDDHIVPSVNACGDVVFTSLTNNIGTIYRLGNNSPCVTDAEPNNILPEATLVSGNTTTMGMVQDPGDWEDWYKFTANTGDQITVTVNWAPTVAPNMLMVELMDQSGGGLAGAPEPGSPKTITYTAQYNGAYHIRLLALNGSRIGYTLTLKVGLGGGTCADPVSPGPDAQDFATITDLGEVIWSQFDPGTGFFQIYSSTRGQLTSDAADHINPSANSRGDVVWEKTGIGGIYGLINGQVQQVTASGSGPAINDSGEVVWNYGHIYSNRRGRLTTDPVDSFDHSINNAGDVVWSRYDPVSGRPQVYKLAAGTITPVQVTSGPVQHEFPSISNSGEIVWSEGMWPGMRIRSNLRDVLTADGCPAGDGHVAPSVNSCGDVVFTGITGGVGTIYRLGNSSPCVMDTSEPNGNMTEATLVSGNSTTTGMVQAPGDWEDWYKFTANAGDQIKVSVNWAPTVAPNMLMVALMDKDGIGLAGAPEPGSPKSITYTAQYTGTYHVHLMALANSRVGYTLSLKVGLGGGICAEPIAPGSDIQEEPSINDLGEVVWQQFDAATGYHQIHSSTHGQLTFNAASHRYPALNNRGDVVWTEESATSIVRGLIDGQLTQIGDSSNAPMIYPSINDDREIVWIQNHPTFGLQVYSNRRGYLTSEPSPEPYLSTSINNAGDVVWTQYDPASGMRQVYKLTAGMTVPVQVTNDPVQHDSTSISNSGEIVWAEGPWPGAHIRSSLRGVLTFNGCPGGDGHLAPSVNACGDVVFANMTSGIGTIYRLGNSSPCTSDGEPNGNPSEATLVTGNTTTTGMVQDPGDWEDWYKFTANAGDQIKVSVNWAPTVAPNMLMVNLMDKDGIGLAGAPEPGSPKTITYTATYNGTYHVHLMAMAGSRIGYTLTLKVGLGGGTCADPVSPSEQNQSGSSMNDLGEIVWSEYDPTAGFFQIYSNMRGQLTSDLNDHFTPSINNRGNAVWSQFDQTGWKQVYKLMAGTTVPVAVTNNALAHENPSINDKQEIVWTQYDAGTGVKQVYSNRRGFLTTEAVDHGKPSINNAGDVVWSQFDQTGWEQIYKLAAGVSQPVAVTTDPSLHWFPSINDGGEVVWSQGPSPLEGRIFSNTRGQLTFGCPYGLGHSLAQINSCGDVTFTSRGAADPSIIYRLGNSTPCIQDAEPNNSLSEATAISGNSTTTGMAQEPGDSEDWYRFTANEGETIKVSVNWAPAVPPNMLQVELTDGSGVMLANAPLISPATITYTALYSGTYYVHIMAAPGSRIAYNLNLYIPATGVTLTQNLGSPQPQGAQVTFTSQGSGGSGSYEYWFRLKSGVTWTTVQPYSSSNGWLWDTTGAAAGTYTVEVRVRNAGTPFPYEALKSMTYTIKLPPATAVTLDPDVVSPQVRGAQISFTAEGSGGSGSYEYWFRLKSGVTWTTVQPYSSSNGWVWDTTGAAAGTYTVEVRVRNAGTAVPYDVLKSMTYTIKPPPVTAVTLDPDAVSPQVQGAQVTFTGQGSGGSGSYEYWFRLKSGATWTTVQPYSSSNGWLWDTTGAAAGTYTVEVRVRNAGTAVPYDVLKSMTYTIKLPPATAVTLDPDVVSPQVRGAQISFTAEGSGGSGSYEYWFRLKTGTTWTEVQPYSANSIWIWDTTNAAAGTYTVQVRVKNAGTGVPYDVLKSTSYILR